MMVRITASTFALLLSILAVGYLDADDEDGRKSRPTIEPATGRGEKPTKPEDPKVLHARATAREIFALLRRQNWSDAASLINRTRLEQRYDAVRSALLDLLPPPELLTQIIDAIPPQRRDIYKVITDWLSRSQPLSPTEPVPLMPPPQALPGPRKGPKLY